MSRDLTNPHDPGAACSDNGEWVAGPPVTPQPHTVEQVLAALHAARKPVYDPSDPVQGEAARLFLDQTGTAPARLHPTGYRYAALPDGEGVAYDAGGTPLSITSHHITVPVDTSGCGPAEHNARIAHARAGLEAELRAATAGRTFARTTGIQVAGTETRYRMRKARVGERVIEVYDTCHTLAAVVSEYPDGTWLADFVDGRDAQIVASFPRAVELVEERVAPGGEPHEMDRL